jgi:Secretion system C-terminal sorting domain
MKKAKLFLLLLGGFISAPMFSQICSPVGSGNNNSFNWENDATCIFYLSSNNGMPSYISNPFFASGTTCNNNISPFCNPPSPNNDISSADGWAYVTHDFGQSNNTIECPVFVLYNIYSGMLRVFFYKSLTTPGNSGVVEFGYKAGAKRTALLEHYGGTVRNAVQVFDNSNKTILAPNTYVLAPSWSHADFVTQYDPCTCQSTSAYTFKLVSTSNSSISFTVNGQVKQDVKANQAGGATQAFTLKSASDGLTAVGNLFGLGAGSPPTPAYNNIFNDIVGFFGTIGKVVKAADFFLGLFKKEPAPPKIMPLVFNVNLTGSGSISTDNPLQLAPFNNPGSNLSNVSVANRPAYNNIMGTFALLKTPQIKYTYHHDETCTSYYEEYFGNYDQCDYQVTGKFENLSDIKWVLNPQSQLSVDKLVASYVITTNTGVVIESKPFPLGCFNNYKPVFYLGQYSWTSNFGSSSVVDVNDVVLKITGSFDAPNNQKLVYTSLYKVDLVRTVDNFVNYLVEELPDENCTTITPSASFSEIQTVCNSYQYTSRRDQFYKAPTNENNDFTLKNSSKNIVEMVVSPNPASNIINLQYSVKTQSHIKIGIYDMTGKMIKDLKNENNVVEGNYDFQVDLANVSSGLYTIVIESNGEKTVKKLSVLQK